MLHQHTSAKDSLFHRLLETDSPNAGIICEKLNHNVKNIVLLSEDELCELWKNAKSILLEAQKLHKQVSCNEDKHKEEYSLMIILIRTVTAMALETITQNIFIPNVLTQNIMLLHSAILPNIKDEEAKNEISYLLENWWKLNMTKKDKVIMNVLHYLIRKCESSMQHVKRLYEIKSSIVLLKCTEDVRKVLKLVREKSVISLEEGRLLILHLFTLGEQYILGIHNNVRVALQTVKHKNIATYADLYVAAWLNATEKLKRCIAESCLQNIIFYCFRTHRDSRGRGQLGKNLLLFLVAICDSQHETARLMIHEQCMPFIWKYLKIPGSFIRCNAVEVLFTISSIQYTCATQNKNKIYFEKYYKTIKGLLKDTDLDVCQVTMNGLFKILGKYWDFIPNKIIYDLLNVCLDHTKNASNSTVRANVFVGLKNMLDHGQSHKLLKSFLPNFASSIYDDDKMVLEAIFTLLWHVQNKIGMPFWDIVPMSYILDRLETTEDISLLQELIKLVWVRVCSNGKECDKMKYEMIHIGTNNIDAMRKFCLYSKPIITWHVSTTLIEAMLFMIKKDMEQFPSAKQLKRNYNKKARLCNEKNNYDYTNIYSERFDSFRNIQICIDVIATLLVANVKNIEVENFGESEENILNMIARELPALFEYFKETSINESVIFLYSSIPPRFFLNKVESIEMLVQQLCNPNTSDDMLLTIVYALMKWDEGETILCELTKMFEASLNTNIQYNQGSVNHARISEASKKSLELLLRILRHLLHDKYQTILINKYYKSILEFWKLLCKLRVFIETELSNECDVFNIVIVQLYKEYVSMTLLLDKKDMFDAPTQLSEILLWVKRVIVPHTSRLDIENHERCTDMIRGTLDVANVSINEYNCTPQLCCDIVLLYCSCLLSANGIIFFKSACDAIFKLLDFGKVAYEKEEQNLLTVVIPNLICVTMIALTRYAKDVLIKYTDDLKILQELTQKYFSATKRTFNNHSLYLAFVTVMLSTAITSISADMTHLLECSCITRKRILITTFPYLAKKILKVILHTKKYRELSVQVLSKTIRTYSRIDMLSALIIINKITKSNDKTIINRLKCVTLATKTFNQNKSCITPFDRSVNHALSIIIDEILT